MDAHQLALYVIKNYAAITGRSTDAMNDEGDFPQEIYDLIDENDVDIDSFQEAWNILLG